MPFPDLLLVANPLNPGATLPYVAENTGVPDAGNNTFEIPFVDAGIDPALISLSSLRLFVEPDPGRPVGGAAAPGVDDAKFVSLSADKREITVAFSNTNPGVGTARVVCQIDHTLQGIGATSPVILSGSVGGAGGGGADLAATLAVGNFTGGTSIVVSAGDSVLGEDAAVASGLPGGALPLVAGAGDGAGAGGQGSLVGGSAGDTGAGGSVLVVAGSGGAVSGPAGSVVISGGLPTSGDGGSVTLTATQLAGAGVNDGDINFSARGSGNVPFNSAAPDNVLVGFTATSIIGALNELKASGGPTVTYTNGEGDTLLHGEVVSHSTVAADTVLRAQATADNAAARVIGFVQAVAGILTTASGDIITSDGQRFPARFDAGLALVAGNEIFLSEVTAGRVTNVPPSTAGNVRQSIGILTSVLTYDGIADFLAQIQLVRGPKAVV